MPPRPDVSDQRRRQIFGAATTVFARLGFQQARMDDIAGEAGLSKGTLYLYFDSKDAIIEGLMRELFEAELAQLRALVGTPGSVAERLRTRTRRVARDLTHMTALLPIAWEFYALAARQERVRVFCREYFRAYREPLIRLVEEGIQRGELRRVDPEAAALAIAALYEGLMMLWITDPEVVKPEEQCEQALMLLLSGLEKRKETRASTRASRTGGRR